MQKKIYERRTSISATAPLLERGFFQKGFTLVELAITLTIIGLLVGGILRGRELMENMKIGTTISTAARYQAAMVNFKKTFGNYPGDFPEATQRLRGCTTNPCIVSAGSGGNGDGVIGGPITLFPVYMTIPNPSELRAVWVQLFRGGFVTDTVPDYNGTPNLAGVDFPKAPLGGGLLLMYFQPGDPGSAFYPASDHYLAMTGVMPGNADWPGGALIYSVGVVAKIDRKMDDGLPMSGDVLGAAEADEVCWISASDRQYPESDNEKKCTALIKIKL